MSLPSSGLSLCSQVTLEHILTNWEDQFQGPLALISLPLQFGLPEDTTQGARINSIAEMSGHGNSARFGRMFVLPMASFGSNVVPPVVLDQFNYFPDFEPSLHGLAV